MASVASSRFMPKPFEPGGRGVEQVGQHHAGDEGQQDFAQQHDCRNSAASIVIQNTQGAVRVMDRQCDRQALHELKRICGATPPAHFPSQRLVGPLVVERAADIGVSWSRNCLVCAAVMWSS